jgi:two-component system, chemotaxis family, response regulator Rcp1
MAFLRKEGSFARTAYPDLVLLDLNLPKKDGREVLREMKNDPQLLRIPVVVLTTSGSDEDILGSYGLHANCYITKPVDMDQFVKVVKVLEEFWFVVAKIPDGRNA